MFKKILLVAGHGKSSNGSNDNGAYYDWLVERELTLVITNSLRDLFIENNIAFNSYWVLTKLSLNEKIKDINEENKVKWNIKEDTILLSIHINSGGGDWIESFSYKRWEKGLELWQVILNNIATQTEQNIRGAKYENESQYDTLGIVHDTIWCTSLLIECWFIDSEFDRDVLINKTNDIARWLYNGLAELCWFDKIEIEDNLPCTWCVMLEDKNKELELENIELKERLRQTWINAEKNIELAKLD